MLLRLAEDEGAGGAPAAVVIFPEGTRSRSGQMRRFKTGVAYLSEKLGCPVLPAHIVGTRESLPKLRTVPVRHPVRVAFGDALWPPSRVESRFSLVSESRDADWDPDADTLTLRAAGVVADAGGGGAAPPAPPAPPAPECRERERKRYLRAFTDSIYSSVRDLGLWLREQSPAGGECPGIPTAGELAADPTLGRDGEGGLERRPVWEQLGPREYLSRLAVDGYADIPPDRWRTKVYVFLLTAGTFGLRGLGDAFRAAAGPAEWIPRSLKE